MPFISSEDFTAICLILAEGEINATLLDIIKQAESYQESADRHFGISRRDFRNSIHKLLFVKGLGSTYGDECVLAAQPFHRWIIPILQYTDLYCCDSGEDWLPFSDFPTPERLRMYYFFHDLREINPDKIFELLAEIGKDNSLLVTCSRPGKSS